jgi:lactoylglutathione lyase
VKIEHIALWTRDLEKTKKFYEEFFSGKAGRKYINPKTHFESYFLGFESGARLEIMKKPNVLFAKDAEVQEYIGYTHISFSVGSREAVDTLTEKLRSNGVSVASEPRVTGDGYYESVVLDPDGNKVEITE